MASADWEVDVPKGRRFERMKSKKTLRGDIAVSIRSIVACHLSARCRISWLELALRVASLSGESIEVTE